MGFGWGTIAGTVAAPGLGTLGGYLLDNEKDSFSSGDAFQKRGGEIVPEVKKYLDPGGLFKTQTPGEKHGQGIGIAGNVNEANFGVPGSRAYNQRLNSLQQGLNNRQTPGLNANQLTQGSSNYLSMLQNQAAGQGPSVAQMQLQQGLSRNLAGQQAMAQSARPGNSALAARMAAQQGGAAAGSLQGQGALARVQEQLGAQQQLGQALQSGAGNYLTGQGQTDQARSSALGHQLNMMQSQQQGGLERERLRNQYYNAATGYATDQQQRQGLVGGVLSSIIGK